jgi:hypothetical protein
MAKRKKVKYEPDKCSCCNQTTTYLLSIDTGTVDIVKAIARFIEKKGINCVHPRKELEGRGLTSNQVGNLSRPCFHGLIAKVAGQTGNYLLTRKGSLFLRGGQIARHAIISKVEKRQVGYYKADTEVCTVKDFRSGEYWEGINYEIKEGQVFHRIEELRDTLF